MLSLVKLALRITTTAFDDELNSLINACILDLGLAGVVGDTVTTSSTDDLVRQCVIAYCKWRFGEGIDKYKETYELQKAQLLMATGYTNWGDTNGINSNQTN